VYARAARESDAFSVPHEHNQRQLRQRHAVLVHRGRNVQPRRAAFRLPVLHRVHRGGGAGAGLSQSPHTAFAIAHVRTRRDYYDQRGLLP
jgi:hypothetical protein